ncbi:MAG: sigma-70 family RNA polymerase sigma factor [Acidobacteriota bacterium]
MTSRPLDPQHSPASRPEEDLTDVTDLLRSWGSDDEAANDKLLSAVYHELKKVAGSLMKSERGDHTLQPTALVHEAYLRMLDQRRVRWQSRIHFYAIAARMMRRILVNHAVYRQRDKRGGGWTRMTLEAVDVGVSGPDVDVLRVDEALTRLKAEDAAKAMIVELRYFGGLSIDEAAAAMQCSTATVARHWRMAKAWLFRELQEDFPGAVTALATDR